MTDPLIQAAKVPNVRRIAVSDIGVALRAGLRDFQRAPQFGLFFSAVYVVVGFGLLYIGAGHAFWVLVASLGFPLVAPFAAVGLYEVSRRLNVGEALDWRAVLGVVWLERGRQIPWLGAIIVIYFLFWTFLAHMLFALFMGFSAMTNVSTSWEVFFTGTGLIMIAVELGVGAVLAFLLFSLMVVSLPLVLEREVDFVTAMMVSLRAVGANPVVMPLWAGIIAVSMLVGLLPWFLGLFVVLPVLGHASWHIYRLTLEPPDTSDSA